MTDAVPSTTNAGLMGVLPVALGEKGKRNTCTSPPQHAVLCTLKDALLAKMQMQRQPREWKGSQARAVAVFAAQGPICPRCGPLAPGVLLTTCSRQMGSLSGNAKPFKCNSAPEYAAISRDLSRLPPRNAPRAVSDRKAIRMLCEKAIAKGRQR